MRFFNFKRKQDGIFFWERIAFRISVGFLVPVVVSAYALFHVSNVYSETTEFQEKIQRMWNVVHVNENKALLNLTKMRLNSQEVLQEPLPSKIQQLQNELRELRVDIDQSRGISEQIIAENKFETDPQVNRVGSQLLSLQSKLAVTVDRLVDSAKKQDLVNGTSHRKEMDSVVSEVEISLGKLRALNELLELKVVERLTEARKRANRVVGFYLISVLFFGIVAAIFVSYGITAPIKQILSRVKDIATGDGDLRKRVYTRSGGEMKELAHWMNLFLEKTQSIIFTISNASDVVRETTDQLGRQAQRTSVSASGISKNMMEQSMNLDECTNSLGSIDDLIQNSAESTRQAASLSKIAMDRALQGGGSVHETIEAMEKIEESAKKVEHLVGSITEIASQTNLLAINAAIEATKAGEHGKGFAVVAEEVRKLAERARKLTAEVTHLIGESGTRVRAGVSLAKGAGVSLDGIIKDVEAVASLIQRIAVSSSKQTESSTLVLEFMEKVSGAVRSNLEEMQEVTKATEFTTLETNKLDSLVNQLKELVGQFQITDTNVNQDSIDSLIASVRAVSEVAGSKPAPFAPMPEGSIEAAQNDPDRDMPTFSDIRKVMDKEEEARGALERLSQNGSSNDANQIENSNGDKDAA